MKYLLTILLAIVTINISYKISQKPSAPTKIKYEDTRYTHSVVYTNQHMIIKIKHRTSGEDFRVYIYDLDTVYGYEVQ
jgi:hypothetical protein